MRDVDRRTAARPDLPQRMKDALDLNIRKTRGRLVKNQKTRIATDEPGNLDNLPFSDRQGPGRAIEVEMRGAQLLQRRFGPGPERRPTVHERNLAIAEPDVVEH